MTKLIRLFMWGYQPHFQYEVECLANNVIENLGISETRAECFLIGAKIPGHQNPNPVCVEPEDGKWPISLFDELLQAIETEVANHPLKDMFYSDEPSMRDKPENIRRDSVRRAIYKTLETYDTAHQVRSFVGSPAPVGDYYVAPVLQLPNKLFERFRPLREPIADAFTTGLPSLSHAAVYEVNIHTRHKPSLRNRLSLKIKGFVFYVTTNLIQDIIRNLVNISHGQMWLSYAHSADIVPFKF